jgi:hypothetical protein
LTIEVPHPSRSASIAGWSPVELEEFLRHPAAQEGRFWDFKAMPENKEKTRKTFAGFANADGGFVFYGISDSRQVSGIPGGAAALNEWLKDVLREIKPRIDYDQKNVILFPDGREVAIYGIAPSQRDQKPHMADDKVYRRGNAATETISSGTDLRRYFLSSYFSAENISDLEFELRRLRESDYEIAGIDVVYLRRVEQYLDERARDRTSGYEALLGQFRAIKKLVDTVNSKRAQSRAATGVPPLQDADELVQARDAAVLAIETFLSDFKRTIYG